MEELEDPSEHVNEKIHEEAHHAANDPKAKWIMNVALFTALVSALAALTSMLSGHHENEALVAQIKASDQWNYYQAKGIKQEIAAYYLQGNHADTAAQRHFEKYKSDQVQIKSQAETLERETEEHLQRHVRLSRGVTLFQVSVAVSAIAIITRRKMFWYAGMAFAAGACVFLAQGLL